MTITPRAHARYSYSAAERRRTAGFSAGAGGGLAGALAAGTQHALNILGLGPMATTSAIARRV